MNLKYYLRGLGIGIIVAAVLMGVATQDKTAMTDEEIKARAAQLGMVEQRVLADVATKAPTAEPAAVTEEPVIDVTEAPVEEATKEPEEVTEESADASTEEPTEAPTEEPTEAPTEEPTEAPTAEPETTEAPAQGDTVTLTINRGESSRTVSYNLAELGLVEDAEEYDQYLCRNGYDKSVCTGVYEIPIGSTDEDIAKIITKKR